MQKESIYRLTQSGDPELGASQQRSEAGARFQCDVIPTGQDYASKKPTSRFRSLNSARNSGPSYPKVAQLNNQLKEIDRQISHETQEGRGKTASAST